MFCLLFFSGCKEYKDSCNFSPQSYFVKWYYINFCFDYKEICLFYGYIEDIWRRVFRSQKIILYFLKKHHHRRLTKFLVRLCPCKMTSRKLHTSKPMSVMTSKSCLIITCQYGYCPLFSWALFALMFYRRALDITLSIN